jgi:hypothetical protein
MNTGKFLKRLLKIIFYCVGAIISVIIIALFLFWMELKRDVTLPDPTGIYSVGRTAYHWIDSSRTDSLSPKPYNKRELIIWIWYPVSNIKSDSVVDYDRAEWGKEINEQSDFFINNFFSRDGAKMHPHSFRNAEISNKQQRYPVILMNPVSG